MSLELKIPPPVVALCTATVMWAITKLLPISGFDFPGRTLVTILLLMVGLLIDILALIKFRQAQTTINPMQPQQSNQLVTSGVYKISRNPMYLGLLLVLISWGIYLGHFIALLMPVMFVLYITKFQIIPEEKIMQEKFGESFQDYKFVVRRWI